MTARPGRVLVIAGSDSGGGAGIQADLRTIATLGGYGMTAVTAVTVQNTLGVQAIHTLPAYFVRDQMRAVLDDLGADAIKIGMLANGDIAAAVAETLEQHPGGELPLVLDTVFLATQGGKLLDADGIAVLKERLLPRATLVTPNIPEAEHLTGLVITGLGDMELAASALLTMGARNVLLKGGHLVGDDLADLLVGPGIRVEFRHRRVPSRHTHGTGCTLSSAIAAHLAQGRPLSQAVQHAVDYVQRAIANAPGFGSGKGPLGCGQ